MRRALAPLSLPALACACWVENPNYGASATATASTTAAASAAETDAATAPTASATASTAASTSTSASTSGSATAVATDSAATTDTTTATAATTATTDTTTTDPLTACTEAPPGGAPLWVTRLGGAGPQRAAEVAVAADGSVYVTGTFRTEIALGDLLAVGAINNDDIYLARLAADGAPLWLRAFKGAGDDNPTALAVDDAGDLALVGHFAGDLTLGPATHTSAGGTDAFLARLTPDGDLLWSRAIGSAGDDDLHDVDFALGGGIVAAGTLDNTGAPIDLGDGVTVVTDDPSALLVAFAPGGGALAADTATSNNNGATSSGAAIVRGPVDQLYLAGEYAGGALTLAGKSASAHGGSDHWVARVDDTVTTWLLGLGDGQLQSGRNLALDPTGAILYGSARFNGKLGLLGVESKDGTPDAALFALDPTNGAPLWARKIRGDDDMAPEGVSADHLGRVRWLVDFTLGATVDAYPYPAKGADALVLTLNEAGDLLSVRHLDGAGEQETEDIDAAPSGCVAVVGSFVGDLRVEGDLLLAAAADRDAFVLLLPHGDPRVEGDLLLAAAADRDAFVLLLPH